MSSHYDFPIFISSTDYNLKDLRAELSLHLNQLGYRAILSSESGFHDESTKLPAWESCLKVLEQCFLTIVIIDSRYGQELSWKNFNKVFKGKKYSPTHGEYRYAKYLKKRTLVFIRSELIHDYNRYREFKKEKKSNKAVKSDLFLPSRVDIKSLEFIEEVKTEDPVQWFREFDNVTDLKAEVQKQLLNELAIAFREKEARLKAIIQNFSRAVEELKPKEQKEILEKVGVTKRILANIQSKSAENRDLRKEITKKNDEIKKLSQNKKTNEDKISKLIDEKQSMERQRDAITLSNTSSLIESSLPGSDHFNSYLTDLESRISVSEPYSKNNLIYVSTESCDGCGNSLDSFSNPSARNQCNACLRKFCFGCSLIETSLPEKCSKCK